MRKKYYKKLTFYIKGELKRAFYYLLQGLRRSFFVLVIYCRSPPIYFKKNRLEDIDERESETEKT